MGVTWFRFRKVVDADSTSTVTTDVKQSSKPVNANDEFAFAQAA